MKKKIIQLVVGTLFWAVMTSGAAAAVQMDEPQKLAGTYADVHAQQRLGRVIVAADGQFMLYEWGRPYLGWAPDTSWLPANVARRLQTFLFRVDFAAIKGTSEYLFYPNAGCTYWLGDLSPDNMNAIVCELNHDDQTVRTGVWSFEKRKIQWFTPRPDVEKFEELTVWVSNQEFVYPAKSDGAGFVQASVVTGVAQASPAMAEQTVRQLQAENNAAKERAKTAAAQIEAKDLPEKAAVVTGAIDGSVAVYVKDTTEVLSLMYKKPGEPLQLLFENYRQWEPPAVAGSIPDKDFKVPERSDGTAAGGTPAPEDKKSIPTTAGKN